MATVMVTGVGAIIGYGVLRSLRATRPQHRLLGADIHADAVGRAWCDVFEPAPLTADPTYAPWLRSVVAEHRVDLVIPGIEQDLYALHDLQASDVGLSYRAALNTAALIELCRDKWLFHQHLLAMNEPCRIESHLEGDYETLSAQFGLPFLLKPRRGYASKGQIRISRRSDFEAHGIGLGKQLMAQPIVGTDDEEYTVGAFGDGRGGVCASFVLRRRLGADGSTAKAWTSRPAGLDDVVARLCAHFRPTGPTNLQFRRDEQGWKLLEINPRISSSTSIRNALGYPESAMCVDYYLDGILPSPPLVRGGQVIRFIEDMVIC